MFRVCKQNVDDHIDHNTSHHQKSIRRDNQAIPNEWQTIENTLTQARETCNELCFFSVFIPRTHTQKHHMTFGRNV